MGIQSVYLSETIFGPACRLLLKGNISYFNLAVANSLVPPRAFLFILLPLLALAGLAFGFWWAVTGMFLGWIFLITLAMGIPAELVNRDLWKALLRLPRAIAVMAGTLIHIRK